MTGGEVFIFIPNSVFLTARKWFVRIFHCCCDKSSKNVACNIKSLQMKWKTEPVVQDIVLSLLCRAPAHSALLCFIISVFLSCITQLCWILDLWGFLLLQNSAFQWKAWWISKLSVQQHKNKLAEDFVLSLCFKRLSGTLLLIELCKIYIVFLEPPNVKGLFGGGVVGAISHKQPEAHYVNQL